jgi:hypothetical protein
MFKEFLEIIGVSTIILLGGLIVKLVLVLLFISSMGLNSILQACNIS